jgi:hypothetical protein
MRGRIEVADEIGPFAVGDQRDRARPLAHREAFDRAHIDRRVTGQLFAKRVGEGDAGAVLRAVTILDYEAAGGADEDNRSACCACRCIVLSHNG